MIGRKTILFVMPNLGGAGAERVVSILLNNLDRKIFNPKLVILKKNGSNSFISDLKKDVEIISLDLKQRLRFSFFTFLIKLIFVIRKKSPDILFMGAGTINAFLSPFLFLLPTKTKKVARESNLPSHFEKIAIIRWMYRKFYNNYDLIIAQSDDMKNDLVENFNVDSTKIKKINNPVDIAFIQNKLNEDLTIQLPKNKINLLAAGRLTYQKGFDLLIQEFSEMDNNNLNLTILGEGEDEANLKHQVKDLGLEDKITFTGNVPNPYLYMQKSDVFILSSRFEGFPNVLLESLACGCPILANNCPGGINEIVKDGINGFIFSFKDSNLIEKMSLLIESGLMQYRLPENAAINYSVKKVIDKYSEILNEDA
ncbi:glycosyltransferase [Sunxiuqinia sp. A32]|uniref:glycosyltransferase n=1 Tax=Sunxiuqinia sp. A32 TaxID=3461496 RepID=UPI0040468357